MPTETHYTASIQIYRVDKSKPESYNRSPVTVADTKRDVTELLTVAIRAKSLPKLLAAIESHTNAVEDDD